jgi:dihydrofolate reductase
VLRRRPLCLAPLDLDQLDEDDNFVATTLMDQYYATLAETWFGVPAGDLLPGSPTPSSRKPHSQLAIRRETRSESERRSVCIDMKLTVQTFLTLDGVMQAPGGPEEDPSDTFTHGGWQAPFPDPAVGEFVTELNSHASAFLFGRRTFDIFRGYWPDQTDPANPIATAINSLPKYVVSNSLSEADATWRGEHPDTARLVTGDVVAAVQALKDEPGDELQIWGSSKLLQALLQHELVDRFRLMTFPLVLGSGRRLFNDGILPATMRPVDLTVTDLGIVLGTYEPAGPVRHGQM